ncbi:uncharacterized protein LOC118825399 [Colossoma macropomum]|uniref:uncharacterized protein LOC118825399 n=1 Tax=Colossoma macropomum TaxID=42526 RepID=UPI00186453B7|nr:uncharacterized protein LOC118825399 [Colossoma macropomum]
MFCTFQDLERAVFYFLWGSKWERLRREVVKKRPENGGKGLPDPHLFLGSKFIALHVQYAMTPSRDNKTAAMARFWMGSYLQSLRILTPDLRTPVSFTLPPEYGFIKKFLRKYFLEKENVTILTNAKSMVSLVQDREEVSPVPGLTLSEAKQVWKNAAHPALQNKHKDLCWLAAHEILPVRAVMHSRGMGTNPICPRPGCGEPETVRHALWECSVARDLWGMIGPLQCPSLPAGAVHPLVYRLAVNGVGQGTEKLPAEEFRLVDRPQPAGGTERRHSEEGAGAARRGVQTTTVPGSRRCPPKENVTPQRVEQRAWREDLRWNR